MPNRLYLLIPLLFAAFAAHYYHWDDRLVQEVQEWRTPEYKRENSVWLANYNADISAKPIPELLKAETSGLTWHAPSNSLFTITGKIPKLAQLSLDGRLLRKIKLSGVADPEGIAVLSDGRFALVDERQGKLVLFALPEAGQDTLDLSTAIKIDLAAQDSAFLQPKNKGLEGLTWDEANSRFILAKERNPHQLYSLEFDLASNQAGQLTRLPPEPLFMRDISGLALDAKTGHLLVLSDESRLLLELNHQHQPVSYMSLMGGVNVLSQGVAQAEGIAMDSRGTIYVVGEPNLFYRFIADKPNIDKPVSDI